MADLDVQRKKKSPLPWILIGLLLLALLVYFLWDRNKEEDNITPATNDSISAKPLDTIKRQ